LDTLLWSTRVLNQKHRAASRAERGCKSNGTPFLRASIAPTRLSWLLHPRAGASEQCAGGASRCRLPVFLIRICLSRGPLNLAPLLFVIPLELAPFRELLLALGARDAFPPGQYAEVLAEMAAAAGGKPLDATQLEQAISIVQAGIGGPDLRLHRMVVAEKVTRGRSIAPTPRPSKLPSARRLATSFF
jgi:hypothetical protein